MRSPKSCALLTLLPAVMALGCPPSDGGPGPQPAPQPTSVPGGEVEPGEPVVKGPFSPAADAEMAAVAGSNNAFAAALYGHLAKSQPAGFAASPASISVALAMTYAGARAETSQQMHQTLRLSLDSDTTHRAFGTLLRSWEPKPKAQYELTVANRLFGYKGAAFESSFVDITQDHYKAPLEKLDFKTNAEASRKHINGWVSDATKAKITDLLPEGSIKPETVLVLTNAIYFNGTWVDKFDKEATQDKPFFTPKGEVKVPTMHLEHHLKYGEADGNKLLSLFYRGSSIAMTIVLPDDKDGLAQAEEGIANGKLDAWVSGMGRAKVSVALPKFEISGASLSLKKTLSAMGMPLAFDEQRANFTGMASVGDPNLCIGDVFHKAFVDVHEEGTEAAAATGVVMIPTSMPLPSEPRHFVADHPFAFFIRDVRTGSILFMGRVTDPSR